MLRKVSFLTAAAAALAIATPQYGTALPIAPPSPAQVEGLSNLINVAQQKSGGGQAKAKASPAKAKASPAKAKASPSKAKASPSKAKASPAKAKATKTVVKRNVVVKRTVIVRPYRAWVHRPYYGTIIAGVALGTVIVVSAPHIVPVAPAPNLCWYWSDPAEINGYWDYCVLPPL